MVVVGGAVAAVGGDVHEVGALHEAQVLEDDPDLPLAREGLRHQVLEVGVGAIHVHAVGGEEAQAEDVVGDRLRRVDGEDEGDGFPGHEEVALAAAGVEEAHLRDLHLAASPAPLAVEAGLARPPRPQARPARPPPPSGPRPRPPAPGP